MRLLASASFVLGLATAELFPSKEFLRWQWQSSIVDGSYLYIAGGEVYTLNTTDNTVKTDYDSGIFVIDITKPWTTTSVTATNIVTEDDTLKVRRPSMFHDGFNKSINFYGGWPYATDTPPDPYISSWAEGPGVKAVSHARIGLDSGKGFPFTRKAGSLWAASDKAYYSLGGFGTSNTDPHFQGLDSSLLFTESGLFEFDYQGETLTNATTTFNRVHGEAQFIPNFGDEGVLIFLGGDKPTTQTYGTAAALVDMSTITIYDIKSKTFYDQPTTGSVAPKGRAVFCSVAASGSNTTSYEIFIFGGIPGTVTTSTQADMGTVWILSLPAFQWIPAATGSQWRYGNNCQLIGNGKSQMLNIGGVGDLHVYTTHDDFPSGLGIFNMNTLQWQDNYDPNAIAYAPPQTITNLYDSKGIPKTAVTFSNPTLSTIFKSTTASETVSNSNSPAPSTKAKVPVGAIAGGVVGGVALAAGLVVLGVFLLRRRRRLQKQPKEHVYDSLARANVESDVPKADAPYPQKEQSGQRHEMDVWESPQEMDTETTRHELG